jgi:hypothetical protein
VSHDKRQNRRGFGFSHPRKSGFAAQSVELRLCTGVIPLQQAAERQACAPPHIVPLGISPQQISLRDEHFDRPR